MLIAYFFGVIIHKIEKIMYDLFPYFDTNKTKTRLSVQSNRSCYVKLKEQIGQIINNSEHLEEIDINKCLEVLYYKLPANNAYGFMSPDIKLGSMLMKYHIVLNSYKIANAANNPSRFIQSIMTHELGHVL